MAGGRNPARDRPLWHDGSLPYFLPRHDLRGQAVFVRQTLVYMAAAGAFVGLALGPWNPPLPHSLRTMAGADFAAPLFWALWIFGSMLDVLPNAERRIELQAGLILGLALLRGGAVIAAALLGGINAVIAILALVAATKALLLLAIPTARYGWQLWVGGMSHWLEQAKYALPVGAATADAPATTTAPRPVDDKIVIPVAISAVQYVARLKSRPRATGDSVPKQ